MTKINNIMDIWIALSILYLNLKTVSYYMYIAQKYECFKKLHFQLFPSYFFDITAYSDKICSDIYIVLNCIANSFQKCFFSYML